MQYKRVYASGVHLDQLPIFFTERVQQVSVTLHWRIALTRTIARQSLIERTFVKMT